MWQERKSRSVDRLREALGCTAVPLSPMAPHWPHPGQLRQTLSYPRLRNEEDDRAFSAWTNRWEQLGWQIYAAMHNDSRGTVTVHMGVRDQLMTSDDVHTSEVPDVGTVHSV